MKNVPDGEEEGKIYKMLDRETARFWEIVEDKDLYELASMIVYSDEPFIEFETKVFSISFEIPDDIHKYLLK